MGHAPVIGWTLTTRNSGIGRGSVFVVPDVPMGVPLEPAGDETRIPTSWTRRPIHGVISVPLNRYPPTLDAELPAGALPRTIPVVPTGPAVGGLSSGGGGGGGAGGGASVAPGEARAVTRDIGRAFVPPVMQPVSVIVCGGATGACANAVAADVNAILQRT